MKRLGIAALAAASVFGVSAGSASASEGPPEVVAVCASISELFETANVQMDPLPEPLGSTAGAVYGAVCRVTG